jgi:hypothetical protein
VHDDSARQKYNVPHAHQLLTHNITLLPFTIDHLGGLGYQATQFLFGSTLPPASLKPQWEPQSFRSNPDAFTLYQHSSQQMPNAIFSTATHKWNIGSPQHQRFGRTYHTFTPTQWATQALALNLCKALSHHLLTHKNRLMTHAAHQRRTQKQTTSTPIPPFYLPPPPFLPPSPTTLPVDLPFATDTIYTLHPFDPDFAVVVCWWLGGT